MNLKIYKNKNKQNGKLGQTEGIKVMNFVIITLKGSVIFYFVYFYLNDDLCSFCFLEPHFVS